MITSLLTAVFWTLQRAFTSQLCSRCATHATHDLRMCTLKKKMEKMYSDKTTVPLVLKRSLAPTRYVLVRQETILSQEKHAGYCLQRICNSRSCLHIRRAYTMMCVHVCLYMQGYLYYIYIQNENVSELSFWRTVKYRYYLLSVAGIYQV